MECKQSENSKHCTCTADCPRHGLCCECVAYHRNKNQIPGCFFDKKGEAAWNRNVDFFIECHNKK